MAVAPAVFDCRGQGIPTQMAAMDGFAKAGTGTETGPALWLGGCPVGPHVKRWMTKRKGDYVDAIRAEAAAAADSGCGLGAAQIYFFGPQGSRMVLRGASLGAGEGDDDDDHLVIGGVDLGPPGSEGRRLRDLVTSREVTLAVHGSYTAAPWNPDKPHGAVQTASELATVRAVGAFGLVIHLGLPGPEAVRGGLARVAARLESEFPLAGAAGVAAPTLFLENPWSKNAPGLYSDAEGLLSLLDSEEAGDGIVLGLCVDTAHLYTAGADIASYESAAAWLEPLGAWIEAAGSAAGRACRSGRLLFHLNDSSVAPDENKDRHAPLFLGKLWGDFAADRGGSGCRAFLDFAARHGVPAILERNKKKDDLLDERGQLDSDYVHLAGMAAGL